MANPKGNPQNLKPVKDKNEAINRGRKGGIKSQQVRRERKKAKECMEMILSLDVKGDKNKKLLTNLGIKDEEQQNIMLLMSTMFMKAASTGDPNAIQKILEIAGEYNVQTEQQSPTINISVSPATKEDIKNDE